MTKRKIGIWLMWLSLVVAIGAALYTLFGYSAAPGNAAGRPAKAAVGIVYFFPAIMAAAAAGFVPFFLGVYLWATAPDDPKK